MKLRIQQTLLAAMLLLAFIASSLSAQAQTSEFSRPLVIKANLLSPIWQNASAEVEYMHSPKWSIFLAAGLERSFEDLHTVSNLGCTENEGFGVSAGVKWFLKSSHSPIRTVNGLALKASLSYNLTDEVRQTCPSFAPLTLERINRIGLNTELSYQRVFLDRIFIEAQAGLGYAVESVVFTVPEPLAEVPNETRFRLLLPFGLNLGIVF